MNHQELSDELHSPDPRYDSLKLSLYRSAFHNLETNFLHDSNNDHFGWVPLSGSLFLNIIIEAKQYLKIQSPKFIDVGCGIGTKVILASSLFESFGIEYDLGLVSIAKNLQLNVSHADALEWKDYDKFDLVYFYRLFKNVDQQVKLERHILEHMRSNSLLAPICSISNWEQLGCKRVSKYFFEV